MTPVCLCLGVFSLSLFSPTYRFDLPMFLCRTSGDFIAKYIMDDSYGGWPLKGRIGRYDSGFYDCGSGAYAIFHTTVSSLTGPPGFSLIGQLRSLLGPSDIVSRDFSSMIKPESLSHLGPLPTRWAQPVVPDTGVVDDMLFSVFSPITHDFSVEPVVAGVPLPMAPVDPDDGSLNLGSSLNRSFSRSLSNTSVQSEGTFYSAADSPTDQALVLRHSPTMGRRFGREGPFVATNPHPRIGGSIGSCACYCTTYQESDFASPLRQFGLPLHHPRFLEWVGAPESARLLNRAPGTCIRYLSRVQSIDAVRHLHCDACLMTSNLNILDQYVLCLQGTATKLLELTLALHEFPSAAVAWVAPVPRVGRASIHMEALDLWRSPLDSVELTRDSTHSDILLAGPTACTP